MLDSLISTRIFVLLAAIVGYHFFFPFNAFHLVCAFAGAIAYVLVLVLQPCAPQSLVGKKDLPPPSKIGVGRHKQKPAHMDICKTNGDTEKRAAQKASTHATTKAPRDTGAFSNSKSVKAAKEHQETFNVAASQAPNRASKSVTMTAKPHEAAVAHVEIAKSETVQSKVIDMVEVTDPKIQPSPMVSHQLSAAITTCSIPDPGPAPGLNTKSDIVNTSLSNKLQTPCGVDLPNAIEAPSLSDPVSATPFLEYVGTFPTKVLSSQKEKTPSNKPSRTPIEREIRKLEKKLRKDQRFQGRTEGGKPTGKQPENYVKSEDLEQRIADLRLLHCVMEQADEGDFLPMQLMNEASSSLEGQCSTEDVPKQFAEIELCDVPPGFEDWWQDLPFAPPPGLEKPKTVLEADANSGFDCTLPVGLHLPQERIEELAQREDTCWCWMNQGWCPRGAHCQWKHPPLWCMH